MRVPCSPVGLFAVLALIGCGDATDKIVINEFVALNTSGFLDNGTHPDWIELYNRGGREVDLSGWYMTDDITDPFRWKIPNGVTIEGKGYLVIVADNDPEQGDEHAEFQLDTAGEDVAIFGPDDLENPEVDAVVGFGAMRENTSLARIPDGTGEFEVDESPTPGTENE